MIQIKNIFKDIFNFLIILIKLLKNNIRCYKIYLKKQNKLKKVHIFGNGPSLQESLSKINKKEDHVLMVNYSILTKLFDVYKPKIFVLADPKFFDEGVAVFEKDKIIQVFEKIEKIDYELKLIIPSRFEKKINIHNQKIKLIFINETHAHINSDKIRNKLFKFNIISPYLINVVILALYFSIQEGYNEIYMHGIDSDWYKNFRINEENEIILERSYYYGKSEENFTKDKGLEKGYFWNILLESSEVLKQYRLLSEYAKSEKVKVYNCSKNSVVDSLERLS